MEITIIFKSLDIKLHFKIMRNSLDELDSHINSLKNSETHNLFKMEESANILKIDDVDFQNWQINITRDFANWINELEQPLALQNVEDPPDLYSFYEKLTALTNDMKKGSRKNADTLSHVDTCIDNFVQNISDIKERLINLENEKINSGSGEPKELLLSFVGIAERILRIQKATISQPVKGLFGTRKKFETAFEGIRKAIEILVVHMDNLLSKEGVVRIVTKGEMFDPAKMIAITVETKKGVPVGTVMDEIVPGYEFNNTILKFAEVKVAK